MFGPVKRGAVAVPLFTLFGAEGVRLRVQDCTPRLLLTTQDKAAALHAAGGPRIVAADAAFIAALAPLAPGIETGAYGGRFSAERLLQALRDYGTTNLSAAATHYRMIRNSGRLGDYRLEMQKLPFPGEPNRRGTAQ